eukprot:Awhi_evm1s5079
MCALQDVIEKQLGKENCHVLNVDVNEGKKTLDGIITGGDRLVQKILVEVEAFLELNDYADWNELPYFSFIGYSLGGIYGRYAIAQLDVCGFFDSQDSDDSEDEEKSEHVEDEYRHLFECGISTQYNNVK